MKKLLLLFIICASCATSNQCKINYGTTISGPNNQTVCINNAITPIVYVVSNATGATAVGLPAGVSGVYKPDTFIISGSPNVSGTFNYTVNTIGNCTPASATGTITVQPLQTIQIKTQ